MKNKLIAALTGLTLAATLFSTGGAMAYADHAKIATPSLITQTAALTPLSMRYFCARNPAECATSSRGQVTMSPSLMATLTQVNAQVNRAIRPQRDGADVWQLNPTSGDCEDYVLSKRSALIRKGVPSGSLRIAYTHTRRGAPHAVLVVKTSQGGYVLDNLSHAIKTVGASGYNIKTISSANPSRWTAG